jgi:hypothetical protein
MKTKRKSGSKHKRSSEVFKKGQPVEMTTDGLVAIRMKPNGTIKQHRNGDQFSSTGVVVSAPRNQNTLMVRLDSAPENSSGEYYAAKFWKPIVTDGQKCYTCDGDCERNDVRRTLARGPREGQEIGPLCDECEESLDSQVLLKPIQKPPA